MIGETVTVVRSVVAVDEYGDQVFGGATTTIDVARCAVAPRYANEDTDNRQAVITGVVVYFPAGTTVEPTDRLIIRGDTYEIEGQPGGWVSPFTGAPFGVEVAATRTTG